MKIDSGAVPLSLALLKALGGQQPPGVGPAAPAAQTAQAAAKPPAAPAAPVSKAAAAPSDEAAAAARTLPRGSFVDLRV